MKFFGIDVGGTTIKIGLVDEHACILDKWAIKTDISNQGENVLRDIYHSIMDYLKSHQLTLDDIDGFGFGIPGPIKDSKVSFCANLGWGEKDLKKEFLELLGCEKKVKAGNDATVAAAAEFWKQNGKYSDLVMFTLGTGVGGGIIIDKTPLDGFNGAGGEVGHIVVDFKYQFDCNCGQKGCFETVASATGIVRLARYWINEYQTILVDDESLTAKAVFDAAKQNDPLAVFVCEEVGYYIGYTMSMIAATVNPQVFALGGGVSQAGDILLSAVERNFKKYAFKAVRNTEIILADLGNDAGIIGAAYLVK